MSGTSPHSRPYRRAVGAGAKHELVLVESLLATLVHLRHGATHDVLTCWFGVDRSTATRAIGEVRPMLAMRGMYRPCGRTAANAGRGRRGGFPFVVERRNQLRDVIEGGAQARHSFGSQSSPVLVSSK
jgi:hypothetical protein